MSALRRLAAVLLFALPAAASAHEGSTGYLTVRATSANVGLRLDVALIDLALALPLDADGDGRLAWREVEAGQPGIARLIGAGLAVERGGTHCPLTVGPPWLTERLGLPYLSLDAAAECPGAGRLGISSSLFFDGDASHRLLVSVESGAGAQAATLAPGQRRWEEPDRPSGWRTAATFLRQGMFHVWIGYDHLVFLLLLLLPAVATDRTATRGRAIAWDLARIVTAFTAAHSITLGLAATAVLRLPQQPIEVAIALSLVVAGALNLSPRARRLRLPLAFGFGLVHGFGFANALAGLDAGGAPLLPVLAGFNAGVEIANLAVIAVLLPPLAWLGRRAWYAPRAMPALSAAAAVLGALWIVERL